MVYPLREVDALKAGHRLETKEVVDSACKERFPILEFTSHHLIFHMVFGQVAKLCVPANFLKLWRGGYGMKVEE